MIFGDQSKISFQLVTLQPRPSGKLMCSCPGQSDATALSHGFPGMQALIFQRLWWWNSSSGSDRVCGLRHHSWILYHRHTCIGSSSVQLLRNTQQVHNWQKCPTKGRTMVLLCLRQPRHGLQLVTKEQHCYKLRQLLGRSWRKFSRSWCWKLRKPTDCQFQQVTAASIESWKFLFPSPVLRILD